MIDLMNKSRDSSRLVSRATCNLSPTNQSNLIISYLVLRIFGRTFRYPVLWDGTELLISPSYRHSQVPPSQYPSYVSLICVLSAAGRWFGCVLKYCSSPLSFFPFLPTSYLFCLNSVIKLPSLLMPMPDLLWNAFIQDCSET